MSKVILIYGSTTGNTEKLSESVAEGLELSGLDIKVKRVEDSRPQELEDYDLIILGCPTWGEGELQDDFIPFEEGMENLDLNGKKAAVFGPGDSDYELFCEAVNILEKRLKECGAQIVIDSLKVDGDIEDSALKEAESWAQKLGKLIKE